jgi:hypothetical protein
MYIKRITILMSLLLSNNLMADTIFNKVEDVNSKKISVYYDKEDKTANRCSRLVSKSIDKIESSLEKTYGKKLENLSAYFCSSEECYQDVVLQKGVPTDFTNAAFGELGRYIGNNTIIVYTNHQYRLNDKGEKEIFTNNELFCTTDKTTFTSVISHEMAHTLQSTRLADLGKTPLFLREGLTEYLSFQAQVLFDNSIYESQLEEYVATFFAIQKNNRVVNNVRNATWIKNDVSTIQISPSIYYTYVPLFFEWLKINHKEQFNAVMKDLHSEEPIEKVFNKHFDNSEDFAKQFYSAMYKGDTYSPEWVDVAIENNNK